LQPNKSRKFAINALDREVHHRADFVESPRRDWQTFTLSDSPSSKDGVQSLSTANIKLLSPD
jgi:hypothetical protein